MHSKASTSPEALSHRSCSWSPCGVCCFGVCLPWWLRSSLLAWTVLSYLTYSRQLLANVDFNPRRDLFKYHLIRLCNLLFAKDFDVKSAKFLNSLGNNHIETPLSWFWIELKSRWSWDSVLKECGGSQNVGLRTPCFCRMTWYTSVLLDIINYLRHKCLAPPSWINWQPLKTKDAFWGCCSSH